MIAKAKESALKNLITVLEDEARDEARIERTDKGPSEAYQEALNVAKRAVSWKNDRE